MILGVPIRVLLSNVYASIGMPGLLIRPVVDDFPTDLLFTDGLLSQNLLNVTQQAN